MFLIKYLQYFVILSRNYNESFFFSRLFFQSFAWNADNKHFRCNITLWLCGRFSGANDQLVSSDYEKKSLENTAPHLVWFVLENPLGKCFQRRMNKFRFRTPWLGWRKTLRQIVLWKTMLNDQYWFYSTFRCEQCTFPCVTFCK